MQARMDKNDKRIETMVATLQDYNKEAHSKEVDDEEEGEHKKEGP